MKIMMALSPRLRALIPKTLKKLAVRLNGWQSADITPTDQRGNLITICKREKIGAIPAPYKEPIMTPLEFEEKTGLSGYAAHKLLRVTNSKWYEWRNGKRKTPAYIEASMVAHAAAISAGAISIKITTVPDK
jgi:hypothetical protein